MQDLDDVPSKGVVPNPSPVATEATSAQVPVYGKIMESMY